MWLSKCKRKASGCAAGLPQLKRWLSGFESTLVRISLSRLMKRKRKERKAFKLNG